MTGRAPWRCPLSAHLVGVLISCCRAHRDMRKWDEDGLPDLEAVEFGEFVIKVSEHELPPGHLCD